MYLCGESLGVCRGREIGRRPVALWTVRSLWRRVRQPHVQQDATPVRDSSFGRTARARPDHCAIARQCRLYRGLSALEASRRQHLAFRMRGSSYHGTDEFSELPRRPFLWRESALVAQKVRGVDDVHGKTGLRSSVWLPAANAAASVQRCWRSGDDSVARRNRAPTWLSYGVALPKSPPSSVCGALPLNHPCPAPRSIVARPPECVRDRELSVWPRPTGHVAQPPPSCRPRTAAVDPGSVRTQIR